jgi:hypothetical protein
MMAAVQEAMLTSIAAPAAQGMPFKWYHGKTGVVWNVTKRALGVEVFKTVSSRPRGPHDQTAAGSQPAVQLQHQQTRRQKCRRRCFQGSSSTI